MRRIQPQVESSCKSFFNHRLLASSHQLSNHVSMRSVLGQRIHSRLEALGGKAEGKTQGWIAGELEFSNEAVSKWVNGKSEPGLSNLRALAVLLQCTVGYLAGDIQDDDVASIAEMAAHMPEEVRGYYRKSGASLVEPGGNHGSKPSRKKKAS